MEPEGIVTLIIVGLAIAVLALYLIAIAGMLRQVSQKLNVVISAVRMIPGKTQPVPPILDSIRKDLTESQSLLEGLLQRKARSAPAPAQQAPQPVQSTAPSPAGRANPGKLFWERLKAGGG